VPARSRSGEMLSALRADEFDVVLTCTAPSPAGHARGGADGRGTGDGLRRGDRVRRRGARVRARAAARGGDDAVFVTGSLYVVGAARPHLKRILP
jgi:folylpolyglutamate synthase/dihydropteroate synthase